MKNNSLADRLLPKPLKDELERIFLHHNADRADARDGVSSEKPGSSDAT